MSRQNKQSASPIDVRPVVGKTMLREFIEIPWSLYRDDPNWIAPLKFERREAFSAKNPYFEHAAWQAFVAYQNGRPVGRISAQLDRLYLERYNNATGFFGLIEAPDEQDVFAALFKAAEGWLLERGLTTASGPFNLGINQEVGLLIDGFDTPPRVMMGHACPYYARHIENCGYGATMDLLAYEIDMEFELPRVMKALLAKLDKRVIVRPLNRKRVDDELEVMRDIFNDAWSENWGFVPFTGAEFRAIGKELLMLLPPQFIHIAEVDARPAAFIVLLPNINEAIADLDGRLFPFGWLKLLWRLKVRMTKTSRVPLMGVRKKFHHSRLGPALAFAVMEAARHAGLARGVNRVEMSWILESNQGMRNILETIGGVISKRYRVYRKSIG